MRPAPRRTNKPGINSRPSHAAALLVSGAAKCGSDSGVTAPGTLSRWSAASCHESESSLRCPDGQLAPLVQLAPFVQFVPFVQAAPLVHCASFVQPEPAVQLEPFVQPVPCVQVAPPVQVPASFVQ